MKNNSPAMQIYTELCNEFFVVINPDIPNLIMAPDLLIAQNGSLVAVFVLHYDERDNLSKLLVRLSISRLALPLHTKCVFIESEFVNNSIAYSNFSEVFNLRNMPSLKSFIKDKKNSDNIDPIPRKIQQFTLQTAQVLYGTSLALLNNASNDTSCLISDIFMEIETDKSFENAQIPRWIDNSKPEQFKFITPSVLIDNTKLQYNKKKNSIYSSKEDDLLISRLDAKNKSTQIRTLCSSTIRFNYTLDNGIPYPNTSNYRTNIVLANEIPFLRFDPLKIVRAAAFCGLILIQPNSMDDVKKAYTTVKKLKKEMK